MYISSYRSKMSHSALCRARTPRYHPIFALGFYNGRLVFGEWVAYLPGTQTTVGFLGLSPGISDLMSQP